MNRVHEPDSHLIEADWAKRPRTRCGELRDVVSKTNRAIETSQHLLEQVDRLMSGPWPQSWPPDEA